MALTSLIDASRDRRLAPLLEHDEPPALPVHLIVPEGRLAVAKVRAFVDFAAPRLRARFSALKDV